MKKHSMKLVPNQGLNGLTSLVILPVLERTPRVAANGKFAMVSMPTAPASSIACALVIGYMTFDLVSMFINYKNSVKASGKVTWHLYVWHHLLSMLFWPVAILNDSFVYFVNWYIASEASSFWLAIRSAMLTLKTINTPIGMIVQLGFVASFFLSRIVVMPDLVRSLVGADWDAVPEWQANLAKCLVPIPCMLNAYWGVLIVMSMYKVITGKGSKGKKGGDKKS